MSQTLWPLWARVARRGAILQRMQEGKAKADDFTAMSKTQRSKLMQPRVRHALVCLGHLLSSKSARAKQGFKATMSTLARIFADPKAARCAARQLILV
jgi:hypothetical protein